MSTFYDVQEYSMYSVTRPNVLSVFLPNWIKYTVQLYSLYCVTLHFLYQVYCLHWVQFWPGFPVRGSYSHTQLHKVFRTTVQFVLCNPASYI